MQEDAPVDDVCAALEELVEALRENARRNQVALERACRTLRLRDQGLAYRDIVEGSARPLIVELATANLQALTQAGARFRRCEAKALHAEGMTMDRIAEL